MLGREIGFMQVCSCRLGASVVAALVLFCGGQTAEGGKAVEEGLEVLAVEFDAPHEFSSGLVRLYVRNTSRDPLDSLDVRATPEQADGRPDPEAFPILWQRLLPPRLLPGQVGEFSLKPDRPPRGSGAAFDLSNGEQVLASVPIRFEASALRIESVGFGEDLKSVFVYAANRSDEPLQVELGSVGGHRKGYSAYTLNSPVSPGETCVSVYRLAEPLTRADYVLLTLRGTGRNGTYDAHALVRALPGFPVGYERDTVARADESCLDLLEPMQWSGQVPESGPYAGLMTCPAHAHGSHREAAEKFIRDNVRLFSEDPKLASVMHICRAGMPDAWFEFGCLPDIARYNPCLLTGRVSADNKVSGHPFCWLSRQAWGASSPRPFHAVVYCGSYSDDRFGDHPPLVSDVRFMTYAVLASGAKGVLYRGSPDLSDDRDRREFTRLNHEVRLLKPLLSIGCPLDCAEAGNDKVSARTLLAGDRALLIFLLHRARLVPQEDRTVRTIWPEPVRERVEVRSKLPQGVVPVSVRTLCETLPRTDWSSQDGVVTVSMTMTQSAEALVVDLARSGGARLRAARLSRFTMSRRRKDEPSGNGSRRSLVIPKRSGRSRKGSARPRPSSASSWPYLIEPSRLPCVRVSVISPCPD